MLPPEDGPADVPADAVYAGAMDLR